MSQELVQIVPVLNQQKDISDARSLRVALSKIPNDETIAKAVEWLAENPAYISSEMRIRLLRHIASMDTNSAMLVLKSDMEQFNELYPAEVYLSHIIFETYALYHGYRIIPDDKIQSSIRQKQSQNKKGFIRRWLEDKLLSDSEKLSELVKESLDLAIRNEVLRVENQRLMAENKNYAQINKEIIDKATERAEGIIKATELRSEKLISQAQEERRSVEVEIKNLRRDIRSLEKIKSSLLNNKGVADEFENVSKKDEEIETNLMMVKLNRMLSFSGTFDESKAKENAIKFFRIAIEVSNDLSRFEQRFGINSKSTIANKFILYITTIVSGTSVVRYGIDIYQVVKNRIYTFVLVGDFRILSKIFMALANKNVSVEEVVLLLEQQIAEIEKFDLISRDYRCYETIKDGSDKFNNHLFVPIVRLIDKK